MSGYSATKLLNKLSFQADETIYVETTPDWYSAFADQNGLELSADIPATHVHLFCASKSDLTDFLKEYDLNDIEKSLWVSWPKKASGIKTDIGEQDLRDLILPLGWVDVKVAAIDDTWSGLKFLRRKA